MNSSIGVPALLRVILATILLFYNLKSIAQNSDEIWFDKPANYFEETLVLGNGKMGTSIFGGVQNEKIYLNDITLWSGEPMNHNNNPEAYKNLPEIRAALKAENYKLADSLNKKLQG
jgi:alpha-L-fucosidase 2